jgi:hypothetical protein
MVPVIPQPRLLPVMTYPAHGSANFVARWAEESPNVVLEDYGCRVSFPEPPEGCRLSATWLKIFDSNANCLLGIKLEREVKAREREMNTETLRILCCAQLLVAFLGYSFH